MIWGIYVEGWTIIFGITEFKNSYAFVQKQKYTEVISFAYTWIRSMDTLGDQLITAESSWKKYPKDIA